MEGRLNVIAFISGGKDSFFSLLHCIANGHRIIALANLYPPRPRDLSGEDQDLNSYMYQTVGHSLIPFYADLLSLPLYRQEIHGTAVNQSKDYHFSENNLTQGGITTSAIVEDETESMISLLQRIKRNHHEANAVCSGAILSTYQRTRIESVALRLQLVPLAYLWQYPSLPAPTPSKGGLLEDMAVIGLDARIIKVASGGLDEDLLWKNVCEETTRKRIAKAMKRFGGSVLGEGGEFETLVVDGPTAVLKGTIVVREEQRRIIHGGAGEAWVTFTGGTIMQKDEEQSHNTGWLRTLRIPDVLDRIFERVLEKLDNRIYESSGMRSSDSSLRPSATSNDWENKCYICTGKRTTRISNISASYVGNDTKAQIERIRHILLSILERVVHRLVHDIVFTTIILRSMDDFSVINRIYAELFSTRPNPPARVTVACGDSLPYGVNVMLSVVLSNYPHVLRQCLHVQSRSYWAPANIGPYSQAISVPLDRDGTGELVYIAGQIPLIPASMDIVTRASLARDTTLAPKLADFHLQTVLALQHLWRISRTMNVAWWAGAIAFLVSSTDDIRQQAHVVASTWKEIHTQDRIENEGSATPVDTSNFDVWDQHCNDDWNYGSEDGDAILLDFSCLSMMTTDDKELQDLTGVVPPCFMVEVARIPRDSEIEWQALGVSKAPVGFFETVLEHGDSLMVYSMASNQMILGFIGIRLTDNMANIDDRIGQGLLILQKRCSVANADDGHKTIYTSDRVDCSKIKAQLIPCKSIWSLEGKELAAAIVVQHEIGDTSVILEVEDIG